MLHIIRSGLASAYFLQKWAVHLLGQVLRDLTSAHMLHVLNILCILVCAHSHHHATTKRRCENPQLHCAISKHAHSLIVASVLLMLPHFASEGSRKALQHSTREKHNACLVVQSHI